MALLWFAFPGGIPHGSSSEGPEKMGKRRQFESNVAQFLPQGHGEFQQPELIK